MRRNEIEFGLAYVDLFMLTLILLNSLVIVALIAAFHPVRYKLAIRGTLLFLGILIVSNYALERWTVTSLTNAALNWKNTGEMFNVDGTACLATPRLEVVDADATVVHKPTTFFDATAKVRLRLKEPVHISFAQGRLNATCDDLQLILQREAPWSSWKLQQVEASSYVFFPTKLSAKLRPKSFGFKTYSNF